MHHVRKFIIVPQEGIRADTQLMGGKGANLVYLINHKLPVPSFLILSTELYKELVLKRISGERLTQFKKAWTTHKTEDSQSLARNLQTEIYDLHFPEEIEKEIFDCLKKFIDHPKKLQVAVRSSATVEDSARTSFAGIFATYFVSTDGLVDAIKKCWASLWSERALHYFRNAGMKPWEIAMAVILQEVVQAEASGVLFTNIQHPYFGSIMQIEAYSGMAPSEKEKYEKPQLYRLNRHTGNLLESGFPANRKPLLNESALHTLFESGKQIETFFATPQDVEWAISQGRGYILQSRPVTKAPQKEKTAIRRIWTPFFFMERFPHPVSPLGWSLLEGPVIFRAFREPLFLLGQSWLARKQLTRFFYGRPYTDLRVFYLLYGFIPPIFLSSDKRDLIALAGKAPSWWRRLYLYLPCLVRTIAYDANWFFIFHLRKWQNFTRWYTRKILKLRNHSLDGLDKKSLLKFLLRARQLTDRFLILHRWSITYADIFYQLLNLLCKRWLKSAPEINAVSLLSGLEGNRTVEVNQALWKLAQLCYKNKTCRTYFQKHRPKSLNDLKKCNCPDFYRAVEKFLVQYGHRANSLDIFFPTWAEQPVYVFEILESYMKLIENAKAEPVELIKIHQQKSLEKRAKDLLKQGFWQQILPFRRWCFTLVLHYAKTFVLLRENQRFYWQMSIAQMRRAVVELGKRFQKEGKIKTDDYIFFLTAQEITRHILNSAALPDAEIVQARMEEFHRNQKNVPPTLIREYSDDTFDFEYGGKEVEVLTGMPISPGTAQGTARIVDNLSQFTQLKKGDILVTKSLDPGWTPILGLISGAVLEVGGMLSHGSILAREFSIPAVSNVQGLYQKIRDGEKIVVDGNRGQVIKLNFVRG
ncbi:MAG: hypothetical protein D6813_03850 [Calditrichaeota bacterium]|nr:MAG: hypothetical protein D6813_03850 [Calditrichota bacterium]